MDFFSSVLLPERKICRFTSIRRPTASSLPWVDVVFFHLTADPLNAISPDDVKHMPVRDRDALMFRRGVVHTFSTAEHELLLLSYHQPYVDLNDPGQYTVSNPPMTAGQFLRGNTSKISFDAAWTIVSNK